MLQLHCVDLTQAHPVLIGIELHSFFQIPQFQIIGLPSREIQESKDRIRSAVEASGFDFPKRRVVVNLTPARISKRGTHSDLAIACAVLFHSEHGSLTPLPKATSAKILAVGELGLDGSLSASIPLLRTLQAALEYEIDYLLLPNHAREGCAQWGKTLLDFAAFKKNPRVGFLEKLSDLKNQDWLCWPLLRELTSTATEVTESASPLGSDLISPSASGRMLCELAIAGHHHLLLLGPKGAGKTTQLRWLQALTSSSKNPYGLEQELYLELASYLNPKSRRLAPEHRSGMMPFRWVSPRIRPAALSGSFSSRNAAGGLIPGECQLAHGGVLVADEFPEWPRDSRELLREPLESGLLSLQTVTGRSQVASRFLFAATGNFCECGGWPREFAMELSHARIRCTFCSCPEHRKLAYKNRISGPILDRVDLLYRVFPALGSKKEKENAHAQLHQSMNRIQTAQTLLKITWGCLPGDISAAALENLLQDEPGLAAELEKLEFSSLRSRHKTLRVAMTIAALSQHPRPSKIHLAQAIPYRSGDSA